LAAGGSESRSGLLRKGKKHSALSYSKAEAIHLDNLLDDALQGTFPASDPIAIAIDKSKGIAPNGHHSPDGPSMAPCSPEVVVSTAPPVVGLFDANLWALRQLSYFFDWWSHLLGGRK
jgi:hypothetical protein